MKDVQTQLESENSKPGTATITEAQLNTAAGAELLAVCENLLKDDIISPDEVWDLGMWLETHPDSGLPAVDFLTEIVERVIADGKVTREECATVLDAIGSVLPAPRMRENKTG